MHRKSNVLKFGHLDDYAGTGSRINRWGTSEKIDTDHQDTYKDDRGRCASALVLNHTEDSDRPTRQQKRPSLGDNPCGQAFLSVGHSPKISLTTPSPYNYRKNSDPRHDSWKSHRHSQHPIVGSEIQKRILKAKAEGSTVSIVDGCLFIDYKYVAHMPDGYNG